MKVFKGRPVVAGEVEAQALVTHYGFNTLASFQGSSSKDKEVRCSDQNNPDIYKKPMFQKALCLPDTIGSTTGGMVLFTICEQGKGPACMLFSKHIDSLAAAGAVLIANWSKNSMVVVDQLGEEFLEFVKTGDSVTVQKDGTVMVK